MENFSSQNIDGNGFRQCNRAINFLEEIRESRAQSFLRLAWIDPTVSLSWSVWLVSGAESIQKREVLGICNLAGTFLTDFSSNRFHHSGWEGVGHFAKLVVPKGLHMGSKKIIKLVDQFETSKETAIFSNMLKLNRWILYQSRRSTRNITTTTQWRTCLRQVARSEQCPLRDQLRF